jgi:hypothetical protein
MELEVTQLSSSSIMVKNLTITDQDLRMVCWAGF